MKRKTKTILFFVFLFLSLVFIFLMIYIKRNFVFFNSNPISQILFHLLVQIDGANPDFIKGILLRCIILPLLISLLITFFVFSNIKLIKDNKIISFARENSILISVLLMIVSGFILLNSLRVDEYIKMNINSSELYEKEYVDPREIDYTFPEKKRNLIYLFLESVEISEYSKKQGGAFESNYIPELYNLAEENITFNGNNGFYTAPGADWTTGAMIGQNSGIPLVIPIERNSFVTENKFLPGAYSLGEILSQAGYVNELLIGSEAVFGGREFYYEKHGDYLIHDYYWALEEGLVDEDEFVWWGYEDFKLFDFAKKELEVLSNNPEPFNLTLLTVDTHHVDGYVCKYCKNDYDDQLANVYACSSRQVSSFIEWCKNQDFYENTTIIIAGDHCSMDPHFAELLQDYDRKVYYCVINPYSDYVGENDREFCTFDLYPTSLTALGVQFEGDRLGLGTDLFSNTKTLLEEYGKEELFHQINKHSNWYVNHILYGFE